MACTGPARSRGGRPTAEKAVPIDAFRLKLRGLLRRGGQRYVTSLTGYLKIRSTAKGAKYSYTSQSFMA